MVESVMGQARDTWLMQKCYEPYMLKVTAAMIANSETKDRMWLDAGEKLVECQCGEIQRKLAKVKDYEDTVHRFGKFEGQSRYVPYFWDMFMEGWADKDEGGILSFTVRPEDKAVFPELKGRKVIKLYEDNDGFVNEILAKR